MLVADPAQARQEPRLRHDVAALALDGLDDDGGDLVGGHQPLEQHLVEPAQVLDPPERRVIHARQQRAEARVVLGLDRGQAHGAIGPAVEATQERDQVGRWVAYLASLMDASTTSAPELPRYARTRPEIGAMPASRSHSSA